MTAAEWTEYAENTKRIQKSVIPSSSVTAQTVAADGLMLSQQNHAGITETAARAYTAAGMTLTRTDGRGNTTTIRTDLAGRAVSVTDAAGNETVTQYDARFDLAAVVTDALGNTVCAGYDARGRKTAEWGTGTQPLLLGYDEAGRLVSLTTFRAAQEGDVAEDPTGRADGDTTTWSYDEATGLETRKTYADGTHVDKTWDAFNRLATETNARGIVKTCTYEQARGLLAGISYSDATPGQSFSYNHLGQLTQITDAAGTRTFACNPYGEPETDCLEANGLSWQVSELYDGLGRPAGYELSAGERRVQQARLSYDGKGRLSALAAEGMETPFSWTYCEQGGLVEQLAYPNGMTRVNTYENSRDLLSVIDYRRPGSANPPARHEYDYDALGRPTRRRDTWNTAAPKTTRLFTYNSRGELVGDQLRPGGRFGYQYDNIGNRKEAFEFGNTTDYETDELNRYAGIAGNGAAAFVPQYDADGNQTLVKTSTGIWTVTYNAENRPVKFESEDGGTTVECAYDSMGRRFEKKVTVGGTAGFHARYLYRDYLQVAECDLTGETPALVRSYLWDPSEPEATRVLSMTRWEANGTQVKEHLYCMHDAMKNVTSLFGEARGRRALYEYRPYGGLVTSEGNMAQENKFRFSCEYMDDELGLIYYNYRHLNPRDGRWISRDPIMEQGGWNLFAFVNNNSISFSDKIGLFTLIVEVFRYEQREEAIYSNITVSSDDPMVNKCCCLPQFYCGVERGVKYTENLLDTGILNSSLTPENSPPFGPKNKKGIGLTSIKGRVAKHKTSGIQIPSKPDWMNDSDYKHAINDEFRTGDGGDNIHAGANYKHSSGCIVIGISPAGENSYQNSLEQDMRFKAAVACARRKRSNIKIRTKVSKLPPLNISTDPVIPNALEVNEECEKRENK